MPLPSVRTYPEGSLAHRLTEAIKDYGQAMHQSADDMGFDQDERVALILWRRRSRLALSALIDEVSRLETDPRP